MDATAAETTRAIAPAYASPAQAARYSGLGVRTLRRLARAGRLRTFAVGGRVLIAFDDLDRCIRGQADADAVPSRDIEQVDQSGEAPAPIAEELPAEEVPFPWAASRHRRC